MCGETGERKEGVESKEVLNITKGFDHEAAREKGLGEMGEMVVGKMDSP